MSDPGRSAVLRPADRFLEWPARESLGLVGVAVLVPAALVLLTDLVAGLGGLAYVRLADTGYPIRGNIAALLLWLAAIGVWLPGGTLAQRFWAHRVAWIPLAALALVLIVGLAAYGYERTRSILTPALTYASTHLTVAIVSGVFEAPHLF